MLLAQAFIKLFQCWEADELAPLSDELLRNQIMLAAFRSMMRILLTQNTDGSWGSKGPREETAYAILALVELSSLPMAFLLHQPIHSAILNGRNYLKAHEDTSRSEYLWIEKVLYGSGNLSQAYIIAALRTPRSSPMDCHRTESFLNINYDELTLFSDLFEKVPMLVSLPRWLIHASWIEGQLFLPMLQEMRQAVFTRTGLTKDKYIAWIPIIWTLANNKNGCKLSARLLLDMMRISVLNFQTDEFMETVVDAQYGDDIHTVRDIIEDLFQSVDPASTGNEKATMSVSTTGTSPLSDRNSVHDTRAITTHKIDEVPFSQKVSPASESNPTSDTGLVFESTNNQTITSAQCSSISEPLQSLINYITALVGRGLVSDSSLVNIRMLLKAFLNAHVTQIHLNRYFLSSSSTQRTPSATSNTVDVFPSKPSPPIPDFRTWLHDIAAVHTSAPYSMALFLALQARGEIASVLRTPEQRYVVEDLGGCLARMCRLYNDWGSVERDRAEGNLNCVDFAELHDTATGTDEEMEVLRARVMSLAEWERKGLERAMKELELENADKGLLDGLKVFIDTTDLFGQVYVVKDLASRKM